MLKSKCVVFCRRVNVFLLPNTNRDRRVRNPNDDKWLISAENVGRRCFSLSPLSLWMWTTWLAVSLKLHRTGRWNANLYSAKTLYKETFRLTAHQLIPLSIHRIFLPFFILFNAQSSHRAIFHFLIYTHFNHRLPTIRLCRFPDIKRRQEDLRTTARLRFHSLCWCCWGCSASWPLGINWCQSTCNWLWRRDTESDANENDVSLIVFVLHRS